MLQKSIYVYTTKYKLDAYNTTGQALEAFRQLYFTPNVLIFIRFVQEIVPIRNYKTLTNINMYLYLKVVS